MSKMIQIRNVPDELHARLKARASLARVTLSEYLLAQLRARAERPTADELAERVKAQGTILDPATIVAAVRAGRDAGG